MAKAKIHNVYANFNGYRWSAGFDYKGARFHVWFDRDSMQVERVGSAHPILYKNPPIGTKFRDVANGWFETRRLDAGAKENALLVAEMFGQIKEQGLIEKAEAEAHAAEQERLEKAAAEYKINLQKEAGPKLYEALHDALPFVEDALSSPDFKAGYVRKVSNRIRAVLAEAEGKSTYEMPS